ncbi:RNA-binding S4 domain-containing protein [Liquorilactobacillus ghanensis]|jgi:ribosomal 50S subunit-recycling heat shock protein|uniref:RNA-binding S4 domain-containing protein n=1 Tax=Liquorilactobacillus ghanensis TaxID=399370 RepID=UPI0039ED3FF4
MRVDKFLKISRIIKRRTVAKQIADQGRILINQRPAKSATNVAVGDELTINFGNKTLVIKVTALTPNAKKAEADGLYEIISETSKN